MQFSFSRTLGPALIASALCATAVLAQTPTQPAQPNRPARLSQSQGDLAKMIGGTRETVNRCLRDWQRQGILELKGGWTIILRPDALEELAGVP